MATLASAPIPVTVYRTLDSQTLMDNQAQIAKLMFQASDSESVVISEVGSCVSYFPDTTNLRDSIGAFQLSASAVTAAQGKANQWLASAGQRVAQASNRLLSTLLPSYTQPVGTVPVLAPNGQTFDHWITLYAITLPADVDAQTLVPTTAVLELRLGQSGQLYGYRSTWRPFDAAKLVTPIPPPSYAESVSLLYVFGGPDEPQVVTAPYYVVQQKNALPSLYPASAFSLVATLSANASGDGLTVTATTPSVLGQLSYAWSCWQTDTQKYSVQTLSGQGGSVLVTDPGVYNFVVDIRMDTASAGVTQDWSAILRRQLFASWQPSSEPNAAAVA
jgi:hypothetical protein